MFHLCRGWGKKNQGPQGSPAHDRAKKQIDRVTMQMIKQMRSWTTKVVIYNWLVVWNMWYFSIYWEYSSQLTFIFFKGVGFNHQPVVIYKYISRLSRTKRSLKIKRCRIGAAQDQENQEKPWGLSFFVVLPSGKQPYNYGKSPFLLGKLTINSHFQ